MGQGERSLFTSYSSGLDTYSTFVSLLIMNFRALSTKSVDYRKYYALQVRLVRIWYEATGFDAFTALEL